MKPKPKNYDEWIEPVYLIGVGSYQSGSPTGKPKVRIVGFVRPKKKIVPKKVVK